MLDPFDREIADTFEESRPDLTKIDKVIEETNFIRFYTKNCLVASASRVGGSKQVMVKTSESFWYYARDCELEILRDKIKAFRVK
jgi:hypothetical protein